MLAVLDAKAGGARIAVSSSIYGFVANETAGERLVRRLRGSATVVFIKPDGSRANTDEILDFLREGKGNLRSQNKP